jgi:hypothetical protein
MKRLLVLFLVLALPIFAFANDFQLGAIGMYTGTMEQLQAKDVQFDDFTFGAEARLKFSLFQAGASLLYYPASPVALLPPYLVALTDVGISVDLSLLRMGIGLGPNFSIALGPEGAGEPANLGLNLKLSADVNVGNLSVGLVGFYYFESFSDLKNIGDKFKELPWLGLTALVKIF